METNIQDKKVNRLILKEEDILVVHVPNEAFHRKDIVLAIHKQIRKQIMPKKNKIMVLPESIRLSVIGKDKIEEYVSHIDLWSLFDEEGEEIDGNN